MRLTNSQAAKLVKLSEGHAIPKSELPITLLSALSSAGAVRLERSGSSYVVRGLPGKLNACVKQWGITDLVRYAQATPNNRSRKMMAEIGGNSKILPSNPLSGLLIRTFGNATLCGQPLLSNPPGSASLITHQLLSQLNIKGACLVGIENAECLLQFESCAKHFSELAGLNLVLVLRWSWNSVWREWLRQWEGDMLYFPDYDPAGLQIFKTEVLPNASSARLMVPDNFELLLANRGNRDRFLEQEHLLPPVVGDTSTDHVIRCIMRHRKGLEQESLCH